MAADAPLLELETVLAAKIETTTGTAVALSAADAAFNAMETSMDEDVPEGERMGQGKSFDRLVSVPGARKGTIKFKFELANSGSGTLPAWATTFLPACGMAAGTGEDDHIFFPASGSASAPTLTIGKYEDGVLRKIAGAMGTFTITGESGKVPMIEFEFTGVLQAETDAVLLEPTYPTNLPPRFAGSDVVYQSYHPKLSKFSVAANNNVVMRENQGHISGYHAACITDRKFEVTLDPEAVTIATKAWQSLLFASAPGALLIPLGDLTNNKVTIGAPNASVVLKRRGARNGINTDELTLRPARNTALGDDSLTITFQ